MSPQQSRRALARVTDEAVAVTGELYGRLTGTPDAIRAALLETVPGVIDYYGTGAGVLAADFYDDSRARAGAEGSYTSELVMNDRTVKVRRAVAWASEPMFSVSLAEVAVTTAVLSRLAEVVQPEVALPYRDTITTNRRLDPASVGWRRVQGDACGFCRMLADRGAVYKESTARFAAHPACDCSAEPVFEGQTVGPEASAMQYMASKRSRTPAQQAALRSYLDTFYPE